MTRTTLALMPGTDGNGREHINRDRLVNIETSKENRTDKHFAVKRPNADDFLIIDSSRQPRYQITNQLPFLLTFRGGEYRSE